MSSWITENTNGLMVADNARVSKPTRDKQYICEKYYHGHRLTLHWYARKDGSEDSFVIIRCNGQFLTDRIQICQAKVGSDTFLAYVTDEGILNIHRSPGCRDRKSFESIEDVFPFAYRKKYREELK